MGTSNNDNNGGGNKKNDGRKNGVVSRIILTVILFFIFILCYMFISSEINKIRNREITYGEFLTMLEKDEILKIEIQDDYDKIVIYPRESAKEDVRVETYYTGIIETDSKLTERLEEARSRSEADEKQTEKFSSTCTS